MARICEVVLDIALGILRVGEKIAICVPAVDQVKSIHCSAINGLDCCLIGVIDCRGASYRAPAPRVSLHPWKLCLKSRHRRLEPITGGDCSACAPSGESA